MISTYKRASIKDNAMYKVQHKNGKITKVKGWILKNIIASGGWIVAIEEI